VLAVTRLTLAGRASTTPARGRRGPGVNLRARPGAGSHLDRPGLCRRASPPVPHPNLAIMSWLFVTFGEHQVMAQLIAKRGLISPLFNRIF
jgi:hypothetical protein